MFKIYTNLYLIEQITSLRIEASLEIPLVLMYIGQIETNTTRINQSQCVKQHSFEIL